MRATTEDEQGGCRRRSWELTTCWLDMIAEQERLDELVDEDAKGAKSKQEGDR